MWCTSIDPTFTEAVPTSAAAFYSHGNLIYFLSTTLSGTFNINCTAVATVCENSPISSKG